MFTSRRILSTSVAIALALAACGSSEPSDVTAQSSTTSAVTATTTVETTTPSTEAAPTTAPTTEPVVEVELPDFSTGYQIGIVGNDRQMWAVPDGGTSGCEGESGWRIWSVPNNGGGDPFLATATVYSTSPNMGYYENDGLVFTSVCEEQSWQIVYATVEADGTLVNENEVFPTGHVDLPIQEVLFDDVRSQVAFLLTDGASTRFTGVNPQSGTVVDDFILGDPARGCSADDMTPTLAGDDQLNDQARELRKAIVDAAIACDFAELERIGGDTLLYSFDPGPRGPARQWALGEYFFEPYTEELVKLLQMSPALGDVGDISQAYGWPTISIVPPSALDEAGKQAARQQILELGYAQSQADESVATGTWYGYRVAIDTAGNWIWFVAGD